MKNHKILSNTLLALFIMLEIKVNQPTRKMLAILVSCLLEGVSAHVTSLAEALPEKGKKTNHEAKEQRVRRFLSNKALSPSIILPVLIILLRPILEAVPEIILSMDRTYWKKRKKHLNILTVGLAFEGRAIPLFWIVLDYKGNSSFSHWQQVLKPVIEQLQAQDWLKGKTIIVVADREFGSPKLAKWLKETYGVESALRLKRSTYLKDDDISIKLSELLEYFQKGKTCFYPNITVTKKSDFVMNVSITWGYDYDEPLILATTFYEAKLSVTYYERRFGIEPMFKDDKSNGFDIEKTKVTDTKRMETLWIIIALAHAFSTLEGYRIELIDEKANKKKHKVK